MVLNTNKGAGLMPASTSKGKNTMKILILSDTVANKERVKSADVIEVENSEARTLIGYATRDAIILEFSPTIISLLLAGKVGSNIASSIGSMRITEQIDALEVMGVNPVSYLIKPKIFAMVLFNPILISLSMIIGIIGGLFAVILSGDCTISEYVSGLKYSFVPYKTFYALVKTILFAFIISSVSSFFGFNVKGGALEVGKSNTRAVVFSSVLIIVSNYILTQLLLS